MSCLEFLSWLQDWLDAPRLAPDEAGPVAPQAQEHLAHCQTCREQYAAARGLMQGVKGLPRVASPAEFTQRVVRRALADRAERRRFFVRRLKFTAVLAASILLMVIAGYIWVPGPRKDREPIALPSKSTEPVKTPRDEPTQAAPAPLAKVVDEAKEKVAALTGRLTETTLTHAKHLFAATPGLEINPMSVDALPAEPLDAAGPLREAGAEITADLRPVTRSARRAVDFLFRELSTFEVSVKN